MISKQRARRPSQQPASLTTFTTQNVVKADPRRNQRSSHILHHEGQNRSTDLNTGLAVQLLSVILRFRGIRAITPSQQPTQWLTPSTPERETDQEDILRPGYPLTANDNMNCFTLFSKCFSAFVHTTCSLSNSRQYLAFAEVHLRVCTALSNCATCGTRKGSSQGMADIHGTIALCGGTSQNACSAMP